LNFQYSLLLKKLCEERGLQLVIYKKKKMGLRTCNRKLTYENCVRSFLLFIFVVFELFLRVVSIYLLLCLDKNLLCWFFIFIFIFVCVVLITVYSLLFINGVEHVECVGVQQTV